MKRTAHNSGNSVLVPFPISSIVFCDYETAFFGAVPQTPAFAGCLIEYNYLIVVALVNVIGDLAGVVPLKDQPDKRKTMPL